MKTLVVLCVLLAYACANDAEWKPISEEDHLRVRTMCLEEHKVPAEIAEKILKYDFDNDNQSLRCAVKCVGEKTRLFNSETGYNVDRIYEQALFKGTEVTSKEDLMTCISEKAIDEDDCAWAYRGIKCMFDHKFLIPKKS